MAMNGKRLKITQFIGLIIFLISSFQSPLRPQVPDSVTVKYKNALKLLGQDNYEQAIAEMQKIIQEHPDFSQVYRYLVEAYIFRNALDRAQTYFKTLLATNLKNAYAYYALARIDFERKDYDQAITKLKKSITLDPKFADAYSHRGGLPEVYRAKKDLDSAIQFFSALIATDPRNAYAHFGLARSYIRKYAWEKALTSLAQAIELNPEFTLAYHSMIYIFARTGKYDQALLQSENLLKIARKNDDSEMIAYAAMMIGSSYFLQGDYFRALQYLTDALKNAKAIGDKRREGACLNTIAAIYALSANFTKALKYFNEALLLARKTGTKIWEVQALTNLGNVFKDQGDYQQALKYYQQALDSANKNKFKYEETLTLSNMAEVYQKKGDYQQAIKYQQQALRIAVETEDTAQQGFILRNLGTLNQELGNDLKALDLLVQARKIGLETQDIQIIWETEAGLGSYYEKQAKFRQAITHYANAIAIYDSVRNSIDIESLRNNFLEDKYQAYPSIVQLLAQYGNIREAFTYAEKYKAKTILDILSQGKDLFNELLSDTLQNQLQQINAQYEATHKQLSTEMSQTNRNEEKILSLDQQITDLELKKAAILQDLKKKHKAYFQLTSPEILKIDDIQHQILSDNQALIEYILGPEDLSVFVVTSDTLIYAQMTLNRERLRTMLADLSPIFQKAKEQNRQQIFNAQLADFSIPPAYALYEVLVKPIASWLQDATELIIVPDDLLFYLPFEMLVVDTAKVETKYDFENARFLLENFDISYVSSASLLNPNLQRAGNPGKGLLAIGNPDFGSKAGESPPDKLLTLKGSYPDDTVRGETLLFPLPKSETEVKAIGKELSRSQNRIFTGDRATEENFKREAEDYSILHLATHFLTDDKQPLYSKIALAQNNSAIEDGYLQTYEVFNMRLNAALVVLSACNTGLGKLRRGEGMIGIARAFLFAGVPSLVVSLWNVNDESTSMIMKNFYKHLKAGLNKKQALRLAKLDYIKSSQSYSKDPFYWAPFILIGDWHPVHLPTRSSHFTWFMTLVIILILLSTTWIIKNRLRFSSK